MISKEVNQFMEEHKEKWYINYCEAIIFEDRSIDFANPSHTERLVEEYCINNHILRDELIKLIPREDSPLFWLLEKLNAVALWLETLLVDHYNNYKVNDAQIKTIETLVKNKIISVNVLLELEAYMTISIIK